MPIQTLGAIQTAYVSEAKFTLNVANTTIALVWPSPYSVNPIAGQPPFTAGATNDLTVTAAGCIVQLPNANEVSLGMNIFVRNVAASTQPIQIVNANNVAVQTIAAGAVYWIQLTDYTMDANGGGVWFSTQMGANGSAADAAALAGHGLQAVAAKLNTVTFVKQIAADYTVLAADQSTLLVSTSNGVLNLTLPVFSAGFYFSVNVVGSGNVTLVLPGGVTVNNLASFTLSSNQTATFISDGTDYWTLGLGQNNGFGQTAISVNLALISPPDTGGNFSLNPIILSNFIIQFYIAGATPVTADYGLFLGNTQSDWYFSNFCTTNNGSTISLQMGTPGSPIGDPIPLPMGQNIIAYSAINPATNQLQIYSTPTIIDKSSVLLDDGTVDAPSLAFLSDQTSGMYLPAAFTPSMAGNGISIVNFDATTAVKPKLLVNTGDATNPAYSFQGSPTYGMGTAGLTLDMFAGNAAPTTSFATAGGGSTSTFSLFAQTSGSKTTITTAAALGSLSYNAGAFTSSFSIATGASTGTFTFQSAGAPVTTLTTNNNGATFIANNNAFSSQLNLNGGGSTAVATISSPGFPAIGTASIGIYNAQGLQILYNNGANNGIVQIAGSATSTSLGCVSSTGGGASTLSFTANDGGIANINNNGANPISISSTGVVTFPAQNAATLTALMPVSVNGAIAYYNGAAWITLPPGADGNVLTLAGGVPTWA